MNNNIKIRKSKWIIWKAWILSKSSKFIIIRKEFRNLKVNIILFKVNKINKKILTLFKINKYLWINSNNLYNLGKIIINKWDIIMIN